MDDEFAAEVLSALVKAPAQLPAVDVDEQKTRNAATCMTAFLCARLAQSGPEPQPIERTTFRWNSGLINLRNSVKDHLWTNLRPTFVEHLRALKEGADAAYVMTAWQPPESNMHVWVIPEEVVYDALPNHAVGQVTDKRTIRIMPTTQQFERCTNSPDLTPYYQQLEWSAAELTKLAEAVKIDVTARNRIRDDSAGEVLLPNDDDDSQTSDDAPGFTTATVNFIEELPDHIADGAWHEENKQRYQSVLRDPTRRLVELLRDKYVDRISPEVASGKRHISILKKNDYGQGGYHAHYWFAFYDPEAGSKTKSVQLFFTMLGKEKTWQYGCAMGNYCDKYIRRLQTTISTNRDAVANYLRQGPSQTRVRVRFGEDEPKEMSADDFSKMILNEDSEWFFEHAQLADVRLFCEFPLSTLPDHDEGLVDEVGEYFVWAWPFFEASVTGDWPTKTPITGKDDIVAAADEDVDEDAPQSITELSELTSLSDVLLAELEQSLLAKQQTILVGPPGTSKTYIARQFARYFVRQGSGRPQGSHHILYMHANWTYEDFFEGIKPTTSSEGLLTFQPHKGFFLEWVDKLKSFDSTARHVLVLDEINRCDTAAVLGELLQLLEYRGTTIRLLSGRQFVFPRNVFIIGTMNSADRSIGRMDLALRRRFLWMNLHAQADSLQRWLDRVGNNPVGFKSSALVECNDLLSRRGIPREQHIGLVFPPQITPVWMRESRPGGFPDRRFFR